MQDFFYEECASSIITNSKKTKYLLTKIFSILFFVGSFVWFIISYFSFELEGKNATFFMWVLLLILPSIVFIILGIVCIYIKNKTFVDYDYTIVSDSFRISMVKRGIKRIPIINFSTFNIEKIGRVFSETYDSYEQNVSVRKRILTDNEIPADDKEFFYLVVNHNSEKQLLILECTRKLLSYILKTTNRTIIEKDFK